MSPPTLPQTVGTLPGPQPALRSAVDPGDGQRLPELLPGGRHAGARLCFLGRADSVGHG